MGKGGGGAPQPASQTVNQSNLPEYARPYFEDIMTRGTTASNTAYQPYQGQRVADFSPLQEQGFQGVQNLGTSPLLQPAAGLTGAAGLGGLGAGQQYTQQATSPGAMQSYMSPYMQNVVDWQKQQAIQDYGRQLPGQQAAATRAGAFGGSRQAIVESEAQRNLQNQLGGIQAQGTQQAFDQANKNLQFGSQLGLQGLGLAGQMGQQFGQLGQTAFGQQAAAATAQQQAGAIQQAQNQQGLDKRYEEFMQQKYYPQEQLQFLSSLLRGSVVAPQQTMYQYQAAPSMASQIGGLGLGALGLSKAFGAKEGGEVPGYADGGITGGREATQGATPSIVTDVKKQLLSGVNPRELPPLGVMLALRDEKFVKQLQLTAGARNQQALENGRQVAQEPSMYEEQLRELDGVQQANAGIPGMDAGVMADPVMAASGGIIAFNTGGTPPSAQDILPEDLEESRRQRSPYAEESPKERAARIRAAQAEKAAQAARATTSGIGSGAAEEAGLFSRARAAVQPSRLNPSLSLEGLGGLARGAARVGGKFVAPVAAADLGATAYDLYQTPTDTIKQYYGMSGEPGVVTDTVARARAALGMLNPFGSTSEDLRKLRSGQPLAKTAEAAAPQSQYEAQAKQEGRGQPSGGPATGGSGTAIPAARPTATAGQSIKPETSLLYTGESPEAAFARKEAEMEKRFPSELKDRLEELKAQGQQAIKDRDADRWLAVAMGGFEAAAGQSPYALTNFAKGLGLTTKEIAAVNKDFRKADDLRKQIEREERKASRLEGMQKYDAADKARTRVEDITRQAQQADAMYKAKLEELSIKRAGLDVERQKIGILSKAYTDKADQLKVDYVNAVRSKDPARIENAKRALQMYTEATTKITNPMPFEMADMMKGASGGKGVVDFSKLPSSQKQ